MSKAMTYVNAALGSTGFCVIHSRVAYRLMPDSWADAMDASYDLSNKSLPAKLGSVQGCTAYLARFDGIDGPLIKVLARSGDQLAQRIEHVTGFKVRQMVPETEMTGQRDQSEFPVRKAGPSRGDRYVGIVTAAGPITCSSCERINQLGECLAFVESGIKVPLPNEPRRCLGYRPEYSVGGRTGAQLWPELTAAVNAGTGIVVGLEAGHAV
jgi:hypothetical protein